ncbi:uncharacterized protein LOC124444355 isoform X2 [Xenia sp. Carnegie-2017]|uniref:uncharacterized protein LOC124444355 isoform X2 n=1 Tax=Xenia sp. Carnegie-2017 TaxID=2897299 RepID=UPI001F03B679|nr:uncharacterized protein LOC124444355 isoform X2 [Xenia sp. Carnegie-2017]
MVDKAEVKYGSMSNFTSTGLNDRSALKNIMQIAIPSGFALFIIILLIFMVICCKKRTHSSKSSYTVEVVPSPVSLDTKISIIETPDSPIPIYSEAAERPQSFGTIGEVDIDDVDTEDCIVTQDTRVDVKSICVDTHEVSLVNISEEMLDNFEQNYENVQANETQYENIENLENVYETMNETERYSYAYGHVKIDDVNDVNDGYVVMNKCQSDDECEYGYAYDWMTSTLRKTTSEALLEHNDFLKDNEDDNFYSNYEAVSKDPMENVETSGEVVDVEYVKVL